MGKQTNFDWYYENEPEKLMAMCGNSVCCDCCLACNHCKENGKRKLCNEIRTEWLDLPHEEPDSLEKCEEDKKKFPENYWNCCEVCVKCDSRIDGKTPRDRYGTLTCSQAQGMDIARRIVALGGEL